MAPTPDITIVVPVYDEAESLRELYDEIVGACSPLDRTFELVFVDDGCRDGSDTILDALAAGDARVSVIRLRRNFGKSPALAAGFAHARGAVVITLDADLQDDASYIPRFLERIEAGADLVCGWKQRRHDPITKTLPSRIFNWAVRRLTGIPLRDFNCGFKAYRGELIRELELYGGLHRFLPVFAHDLGFRVEQLVVGHRPRKFGASKFGAGRIPEGLLDLPTVMLLTRFRTRPLHFFGIPGGTSLGLGIVLLSYLTVLWFLGHPVGTRPLLTLGVLLTIMGVQILCVGLVAEIVFRAARGQPQVYQIKSIRRGRASGVEPARARSRERHDEQSRQ